MTRKKLIKSKFNFYCFDEHEQHFFWSLMYTDFDYFIE